MMTVTVLFFATLRDKAGVPQASLQLPSGSDVAALKQALFAAYPQLTPHAKAMLVAINKEYAFDADRIPDGAEVALFPPVSGGSGADLPTLFAVTENALDLNAMLASITLPSTGAACFFSGMVRAETARGAPQRGEPRSTQHLIYEAYIPMAEAKMAQVAAEIRERWPGVEGIAIAQRIGTLQPGTPTVLIACTAAHRDSGVFEAARYGIDRLKEVVPIWKKEVGPNGEEWVEGEYIPSESD
ncbi:MAG TPA: molybdopterin converting factor subunit 1 [Anaerolineales bacterium]|nr:molybdopterin converting factor subunit 1 [Anaerolineales bacterium]HRQ93041.1 molybdopterin converting factor subunit 1 [Anaerolineales bacterium]